jgi:hypothetical protein
MPGNIYGVANPMPIPVGLQPGGDVTLTAGVEINIATNATLKALIQGNYYCLAFCTIAILFGATAPTALVFAATLNGGSDADVIGMAPASMVANATYVYSFTLSFGLSDSTWWPTAPTIAITGKASTTAATAKSGGTRIICQLMRGTDA